MRQRLAAWWRDDLAVATAAVLALAWIAEAERVREAMREDGDVGREGEAFGLALELLREHLEAAEGIR